VEFIPLHFCFKRLLPHDRNLIAILFLSAVDANKFCAIAPVQIGTAASHGCPSIDASTQSKVDMMANGISWASASSYKLSTTSSKALDQIANVED
jgi:hypothetical protein